MAQTTVEGVEGVQGLVGQHLGHSDWRAVTQEQVNQFAEATGDHQWIHVDPERAKKESPFGGPIAHGYLTLSLVPSLLPEIIEIEGFRMGVNYGTEKVRFPVAGARGQPGAGRGDAGVGDPVRRRHHHEPGRDDRDRGRHASRPWSRPSSTAATSDPAHFREMAPETEVPFPWERHQGRLSRPAPG